MSVSELVKGASNNLRVAFRVNAIREQFKQLTDIQKQVPSNTQTYQDIQDALDKLDAEVLGPYDSETFPFKPGGYTAKEADDLATMLDSYIDETAYLIDELTRQRIASGGTVLLPNGVALTGHVPSNRHLPGLGGGVPSLPGTLGGGLLGSLGGNRSGRGPGGSQFMPGIGFFPGAGIGPGGVGHGVGGLGLGRDEPPGPWNGGGSFKKHSGSNTGRQPGETGGGKRVGSGYSETTKGSGDRGVGGADRDREKYGGGSPTTPGGGGTGYQPIDKSQERATKPEDGTGSLVQAMPGGSPPGSSPSGPLGGEPPASTPEAPPGPNGGGGGEGGDDEWEGSGGGESAPIRKGGAYFTPHGGSTGGVGVIVAGGFGPRVPGSPTSYLDFLHKNVGPGGDGWDGNNPVVTPAIKPSDLFKPADDSIGPYNPKGTDYRPAPDDPSPGGPAGAAGRAGVRAR